MKTEKKIKRKTKKVVPPTLVVQSATYKPRVTRLIAGAHFVAGLLFGALIVVLGTAGVFVWLYLHTIAVNANVSVPTLMTTVEHGLTHTVTQSNNHKNILILGIDSLNTRDSEAINTDTIMVVSMNLKNGKITTFSFPRDLYITDYKSKINGLYDIQRKKDPAHPDVLIRQEVEKLSGLHIQNTMVVQIEELGSMIDSVGGLDISVEHSFTDTLYPREGVDVRTVTDPKILYETVSFGQGIEHMNGKRALEFIRSRHSLDPVEGTDDARVHRQQLVIAAILKKLQDPSLVKNPTYLGLLLRVYIQDFSSYMSLEEGIALGKMFLQNHLHPKLITYQIPVKQQSQDGVIFHPDDKLYGQWVYSPVDPTWNQLHTLIQGWVNN